MPSDATPRALLAPPAGRDELDTTARENGWSLVHILPQRGGRPRQVTWATPDGEALVTLVEDHRIDARYVVVSAHAPEPTLDLVRGTIACLDAEAVLDLMQHESARVRALCWLGVVGPLRAREPFLGVLREALRSADAPEREAARFAADALGWPELAEGEA